MELAVFNFEGKAVRTQLDESGSSWWIAKDVCNVLALSDTSKALSTHPVDETNTIRDVDSHGREANLTAVNEAGLYRLIFKSRKEEAERFRKFIFSEVLPSIRKTGTYSSSLNEKSKAFPAAEPVFKSLHSVAQLFGLENNQALLYANKACRRETGIDFQNVLQIELKNETQICSFTPTELGSRIGLSAMKFNMQLESMGFQEKRNKDWCATEKGKPYSVLLDAGKKHSDGTPIQQLKWLETVLEFFSKQEVA